MPLNFHEENYQQLCDELVEKDHTFSQIRSTYGDPPMWHRPTGFATLVQIILEQQVSLAAGRAAYKRLLNVVEMVKPETVLQLDDETLRACAFSRQKTTYVRDLSQRIIDGRLDLDSLHHQDDEAVIETLTTVKGIGQWSADVYLMLCLRRLDRFPLGDVALVNAMKHIFALPKTTTKETLEEKALPWKPLRSIACYFFWHHYLCERGRTIPD